VSPEIAPLSPGLYLVATPIGTARDITLRALDILASADMLAAEDTRTLRRLMEIHGIKLGARPLIAYHDHSGPETRARLVGAIAEGRSVAYAAEAGTPMLADPGYHLVGAAREAGLPVTAAPGASALLTALSVAGLPTDRFLFAGFPPAAKGARARWLTEILAVPATLAIYEAPGRVYRLLTELSEHVENTREVAVCRELTKRFEEVLRGPLSEICAALEGRTLKGEVVVLIDRDRRRADAQDMEAALEVAMQEMSVKDAAAAVAEALGLPRRQVYQAALAKAKAR